MNGTPRYPGIRITTNGNQLVSYYTEARITDGGVFYPITPSTEMGESYQLSFAEGKLNVFGESKLACETEGEHSAQNLMTILTTAALNVSMDLPFANKLFCSVAGIDTALDAAK